MYCVLFLTDRIYQISKKTEYKLASIILLVTSTISLKFRDILGREEEAYSRD